MPASLPRKYYVVAYSQLDSIPKQEGNVIATYDSDGLYYDIANPAGTGTGPEDIVRRKASGIEYVDQLPSDLASKVPGTVWIVPEMSGGSQVTTKDIEGNDIPVYKGYYYDLLSQSFVEIFNNYYDLQVQSIVDTSNKIYLTGSKSNGPEIGVLFKNSNIYINEGGTSLHANIDGNAATATLADMATNAISDNASEPQAITSYLHDVSSDYTDSTGTKSTLTFTLGDGQKKTVYTKDTQYKVFTQEAPGLVDSTDNVVLTDDTDLILCGSGWINVSSMAIPAADKASNDGLNQNIANTYIKQVAFNSSTRILTMTYGDDDTATVNIPGSSYSVFTSSADGLTPASSGSGDSTKFLRGDATWQSVVIPSDIFTGATAVADGAPGLVPTATANDLQKFLRSDGTWAGVFDNDEDGLVPKTGLADSDTVLHADGTWAADLDTKNTAGSTNDTTNLLYVIGAWAQSDNPQTYSNSNVYISNNSLYSNGVQVVNLSDSQALTNKTYEGYTLGDACAATIESTVAQDNKLPTGNAVVNYVTSALSSRISNAVIAPLYDDTSTSYAAGDYCMYDDGTGIALLYKCINPITAPAGDFDPTDWEVKTLIDVISGN